MGYKDKENSIWKYIAALDDSYKISGDELYKVSNGVAVLPLGTISIEETKAPEGYSLEGAYLQVGGTGTKITGKYVAQITQSGNLASLKGGNTFKVSDKSSVVTSSSQRLTQTIRTE